jgi:hypothetical protein
MSGGGNTVPTVHTVTVARHESPKWVFIRCTCGFRVQVSTRDTTPRAVDCMVETEVTHHMDTTRAITPAPEDSE